MQLSLLKSKMATFKNALLEKYTKESNVTASNQVTCSFFMQSSWLLMLHQESDDR